MKLDELKKLNEASYPGNIGAMEMFKFYTIANSDQKKQMTDFLNNKLFDKALDLLERVTGVKLQRS